MFKKIKEGLFGGISEASESEEQARDLVDLDGLFGEKVEPITQEVLDTGIYKALHEAYRKKGKVDYDLEIKAGKIIGLSELEVIQIHVIKFFKSLVKPMLVWIYFEDGSKKRYIYKEGDDLHLDKICQKFSRNLSESWEFAEVPSRTISFQIIPFNDNRGLIEFVENAMPLQSFRSDGAFESLLGGSTAIYDYITKNDPITSLENFAHTFVGYYLMGIYIQAKDRHHGNIMIKESGEIFHIDFGFSLGNVPPVEYIFNLNPLKTKFTRTQRKGLNIIPIDHDMKVCLKGYTSHFFSSSEEKGEKKNKKEIMKEMVVQANDALRLFQNTTFKGIEIVDNEELAQLFEKSWVSKTSSLMNAATVIYNKNPLEMVDSTLGGLVHGIAAVGKYYKKPTKLEEQEEQEEEEQEEDGEGKEILKKEDEEDDEKKKDDDDDEVIIEIV